MTGSRHLTRPIGATKAALFLSYIRAYEADPPVMRNSHPLWLFARLLTSIWREKIGPSMTTSTSEFERLFARADPAVVAFAKERGLVMVDGSTVCIQTLRFWVKLITESIEHERVAGRMASRWGKDTLSYIRSFKDAIFRLWQLAFGDAMTVGADDLDSVLQCEEATSLACRLQILEFDPESNQITKRAKS